MIEQDNGKELAEEFIRQGRLAREKAVGTSVRQMLINVPPLDEMLQLLIILRTTVTQASAREWLQEIEDMAAAIDHEVGAARAALDVEESEEKGLLLTRDE